MNMAVNSGFGGAVGNGTIAVATSSKIGKTGAGSGSNQSKKPKKQLNYNPREISSQLALAKKSRNAAVVLARARIKLGSLQQARASGQYKDSEVRIAIAHAKRMVEYARVKTSNLKEEEILKKRNDRDHSNGEQKKRNEIRRRVRQKEQGLKAKISMEETQQVLKEKMRKQQLLQKRRMHRNDEQRRITEADMKYLADQIENNQSNKSVTYGGVSLDLSLEAAQMAELQQIEKQLEHEVEREVEAEYAAMDTTGTSSAAVSDGGAAMAGIEMAGAEVAPVSVDIAI